MISKLFETIKIGKLTIPNRFVVPPMVTNYCEENGMATNQLEDYFVERAKGGWGLIITANFAVTPKGRGWKYNGGIWHDEHIAPLKKMVDHVHKYDSKIALQLYHAGRETTYDILGDVPEAPSPIKDPTMPDIPRELTIEEIEDLIQKFGDAALRGKKAGFDACEVHCAHGYLIDTFLSPFSNKRTDKYGGTIWNRTRFVREVIKNIKDKAGKDYPVICRISSHELVSGGLTIEDTKVISRILEASGVDAIHASFGVFKSGSSIAAPVFERHGSMTDYAAEIKKVVNIPVIAVGRINDPFIADSIIASDKADLVAMGRGSLADPELPNKAKEQSYDDIIRCIGCRQGCSARLFVNKPIGCTLNPRTGNEKEYTISKASTKKLVYVIGGGIAGMETAIVSAKRGHDVHLYEKSNQLGGQWLLAAVPPNKEELNAFTVWAKYQLDKLKVNIHKNTAMTKEKLLIDKPDVVVIATGAKERLPREYKQSNKYFSSTDILSGKKIPGEKVAVVGSGSVAAETANHLAAHNHNVTLLIRRDALLDDYESAVREFLLKDLELNGATLLTNTIVDTFNDQELIVLSNEEKINLGHYDSIVYAIGYDSVIEMNELEKQDIDVRIIGDAKKVRNGYFAIREGYETGLSI
ncbi:NAD(P)/FAD-dependent oxidoreductase [Vallitalea sp.]|jgi:2,4-dienoyl-CoA reductase-like NADH-dependent reductase (Old Yellow Enzyme family)/thioredoxin reductase|uniref:NAD(P)/FAD-dependent oxidoreductase n=1 Tax=Vallitalea sp. TaxID=1882829 RepID=UPI0025D052EB|nr:NAD(P)/FAD-dependent oxidoreductase [Vallitalea sp.]MCT4687356.1 NAD(P)/FAD-dependent oxidoreductase [Vallitalea sp.]